MCLDFSLLHWQLLLQYLAIIHRHALIPPNLLLSVLLTPIVELILLLFIQGLYYVS